MPVKDIKAIYFLNKNHTGKTFYLKFPELSTFLELYIDRLPLYNTAIIK